MSLSLVMGATKFNFDTTTIKDMDRKRKTHWSKSKAQRLCEWASGPVVGLSSGTLPTMVQTLVIAPFLEFFQNF
jgi:hypothetical protein